MLASGLDRESGFVARQAAAKAAARAKGAAGAARPQGLARDEQGSIFAEAAPAGAARTVSAVLGEITWLLTQSPLHKNSFFLADLEWMVMPAVLLQQFRLFYAKDRPVGVALWAYVDKRVEERLQQGNARLTPGDWKSGDTLFIVDVIAPFGGLEEMLKDLKEKVFPGREMKRR